MRYTALGISVRKTNVGRGVFATRPFKKFDVVGQMRGSVIVGDDFDPDYAVDLGEFGALDPSAPFRYLNHSCEPNAELVMLDPEVDGPPTMWVETTRVIRIGEQITIDYAWPAEDAIPCLCGVPSCRGWIVESRQLTKLQRLRSGIYRAANPDAALRA
jgi:hypothetical protein